MIMSLGCSNDEVEPSVLTLLTDNETKSWRVIEIETNGILDETNCQRDDIYTFTLFDETTEDRYFRVEENLISCDDYDSYEKESGSWRINNKGNRLTLIIREDFEGSGNNNETISDFFNITVDIVEISESRLVLRQYDEWNSFDPEVSTITLTEF